MMKENETKNDNNEYAEQDQFVCHKCGIELQDWHRVERDPDDGDVCYYEYTLRYCPHCGRKIVEEDSEMTLEETIEKVEKELKNEIEIISELTHGFQIDMQETTIYKEHLTLVREYMHIKMFLKKLQNMKDEQKNFNVKVYEIIKQAKEKMYEASHADADGWNTVIDLYDAMKILDELVEGDK